MLSSDYYVTPPWAIRDFLRAWDRDTGIVTKLAKREALTLDPCAGGDKENAMSYPLVLEESGISPVTIDIREDSRATIIADYLQTDVEAKFDFIITNPPFNLAMEIIKKSLSDCVEGGFVVMLLRLNFYGAQSRAKWFTENMPELCYVHSRRLGFNPAYPNKTDSIEYMHAVWRKGHHPEFTQLRILPKGAS